MVEVLLHHPSRSFTNLPSAADGHRPVRRDHANRRPAVAQRGVDTVFDASADCHGHRKAHVHGSVDGAEFDLRVVAEIHKLAVCPQPSAVSGGLRGSADARSRRARPVSIRLMSITAVSSGAYTSPVTKPRSAARSRWYSSSLAEPSAI